MKGTAVAQWKRILNFFCFQAGWFACAFGAGWGHPFVGPMVVGTLLIFQLPLVPAPQRQVRFIFLGMAAGWFLDSALMNTGVLSFEQHGIVFWMCPVWMAALWANFAGTLHLCLSWLRGRYGLSCALGVCGGPLAYYAGQRLGAMRLGDNLAMSLAVIAIEWGLVTPALVHLSQVRSFDGLAGTADV